MKCVFCGKPYSRKVGCCDTAAISAAITALEYHTECNHEEVLDAIAMLKMRMLARV